MDLVMADRSSTARANRRVGTGTFIRSEEGYHIAWAGVYRNGVWIGSLMLVS